MTSVPEITRLLAHIAELLSFPAGRHDDQVDALGLAGQLLDIMTPGQKPGPAQPVRRLAVVGTLLLTSPLHILQLAGGTHRMTFATIMRAALLTTTVAFAPRLATADEAISGQWRADLGHNVIIVMDVLVDNHWASETAQDDKVVAQFAGTYQQTTKSPSTGTIVWTPVKSKVTQERGAPQVETDDYTLEDGGQTLKLVTQRTKEEMTFKKHTVQ